MMLRGRCVLWSWGFGYLDKKKGLGVVRYTSVMICGCGVVCGVVSKSLIALMRSGAAMP